MRAASGDAPERFLKSLDADVAGTRPPAQRTTPIGLPCDSRCVSACKKGVVSLKTRAALRPAGSVPATLRLASARARPGTNPPCPSPAASIGQASTWCRRESVSTASASAPAGSRGCLPTGVMKSRNGRAPSENVASARSRCAGDSKPTAWPSVNTSANSRRRTVDAERLEPHDPVARLRALLASQSNGAWRSASVNGCDQQASARTDAAIGKAPSRTPASGAVLRR